MKLLFVLAVTNDDSANAEKFLDFIRALSGKRGHLLLAFMSDVHDEMKSRIRISATLAFDEVHEMVINPLADRNAPPSTQGNNQFRQVARHIADTFNWPFLWMTSQCTPTSPTWRELLATAYDGQPLPYFGNRMKWKPKNPPDSPEVFFMARVGIYPHDSSNSIMSPQESPIPIEMVSAKSVNPKLSHTKLFQQCKIESEGDLISVRDDAIFVAGDKHGLLRPIALERRLEVGVLPICDSDKSQPVKITRHLEPDHLVNLLADRIKPQNGKGARR
jgi:hypothetical protein